MWQRALAKICRRLIFSPSPASSIQGRNFGNLNVMGHEHAWTLVYGALSTIKQSVRRDNIPCTSARRLFLCVTLISSHSGSISFDLQLSQCRDCESVTFFQKFRLVWRWFSYNNAFYVEWLSEGFLQRNAEINHHDEGGDSPICGPRIVEMISIESYRNILLHFPQNIAGHIHIGSTSILSELELDGRPKLFPVWVTNSLVLSGVLRYRSKL